MSRSAGIPRRDGPSRTRAAESPPLAANLFRPRSGQARTPVAPQAAEIASLAAGLAALRDARDAGLARVLQDVLLDLIDHAERLAATRESLRAALAFLHDQRTQIQRLRARLRVQHARPEAA